MILQKYEIQCSMESDFSWGPCNCNQQIPTIFFIFQLGFWGFPKFQTDSNPVYSNVRSVGEIVAPKKKPDDIAIRSLYKKKKKSSRLYCWWPSTPLSCISFCPIVSPCTHFCPSVNLQTWTNPTSQISSRGQDDQQNLVGGFNLPLWKMMEIVNGKDYPIDYGKIKKMFQTTNQKLIMLDQQLPQWFIPGVLQNRDRWKPA